jgi:hypothetical protein
MEIYVDKRDLIDKLAKNSCGLKRWSEKEYEMFSVSEKASEMIKEFLKNRTEAASIRVVMQEGG